MWNRKQEIKYIW